VRHAEQIAALAVPSLWCGLLLGISFIETPLKFRAPGITMALGLGIGRIVFRALNRVELVFGLALVIVVARQADDWPLLAVAALILVLLVQVLWLRPGLDRRALQVIAGDDVPASSLHLVYIALECVKLVALPVLCVALAERFIA
jgi:hypothetical protein